jgi:hypothetical protein
MSDTLPLPRRATRKPEAAMPEATMRAQANCPGPDSNSPIFHANYQSNIFPAK